MADIISIEAGRKAAGVSKNKLCQIASIDRGTYSRLQKVKGSGRAETFDKLAKALQAIAEQQKGASHG